MGRGRSKIGRTGGSPAVKAAPKREKVASSAILNSKSTDPWHYETRGDEEAAEFFSKNTNVDELISKMSSQERMAFKNWGRGRLMSGVQYRGWDAMSDKQQRWTKTFDKYLDQSVVNETIELKRRATAELILGAGKNTATLAELQAMKGRQVFSAGNMSTGAAAEGLDIGYGGAKAKPIEYNIRINGGTKGAGMWIGDKRINGWGVRQREFMTNRDAIFTVGETRYNKKTERFEVDLVYEGHTAHDYGGK